MHARWSPTYTDANTKGLSATEKECSDHLTRIDKLQESSPNHPDTIYSKWQAELATLELTEENQLLWGFHATELATDAEKAERHRSRQQVSPTELFTCEADAQDYRKQYSLQPAVQVVYCVAAEKKFFPKGLGLSDLQILKRGTLNNRSIPDFTLTYIRRPICTEEVKRETVLDRPKRDAMMELTDKKFPVYGKGLDHPDAAIHIWVQAYTQMYLQKVEFATLWSPAHIMFLHREGTTLQVSPFYEADTHATIPRQAAFYLEALQRAPAHAASLSEPSTSYRWHIDAIISTVTEYPSSVWSLLTYWPNYFLTRWRLRRAQHITAWLGHHQNPLSARRILRDSISPSVYSSAVDLYLNRYVGRGLVVVSCKQTIHDRDNVTCDVYESVD